jgi:hypothetical protein
MTQSLEILKKKSKNDGEINWVTSTFMGLFHVGAIVALFFFSCSPTAATKFRNGWNIR